MAHDAPSNKKPQAESAKPVAAASRLVRAGKGAFGFAAATKLRAAISASIAVTALIGVGAGLSLVFKSPEQLDYHTQLTKALASFDAGERRGARKLAAGLLADAHAAYQDHGGAFYILGAITLQEANEQITPAKRQLLCAVAARYLEEARSRGVPTDRAQAATSALGRALHDAGQFSRSIAIFREALEKSPPDASELHALLADSYLQLKPPRLTEALEHHRRFLATSSLTAEHQDQARLRECQILLAQRDFANAANSAAQIVAASPLYPEAVVLGGRALLELLRLPAAQRIADAEERTAKLIEELRRLLSRTAIAPPVAAQAELLIGLVQQEQGDADAATAQFDRTRRSYWGHPEGLAATVFFAERSWSSNPPQAVALYKRALMQAGPAETYTNPWLPADQFQRRLETALDDLISAEQFASALDLAGSLTPLFPRAAAVGRQAETHEAWARRLEDQAHNEKATSAEVTLAEARQHWRQAGKAQRELADLRITTRYYIDDLAHAADDYRRGQGYLQAVAVYEELLGQDPSQGQPEALAGLGESLLALGQTDAALATLNACREVFPKHPMTYRARLWASFALQEKGNKLAEAKELLIDNLYKFSLAPQSSDWRDSLFALGELLYREALDLESRSRLAGVDRIDAESRRAGLALLEQSHAAFEEALRTLNEAVQRYPTVPHTIEARFRIAEAHRHSAKWPRKRLASVTIVTSKAALTRQMQEQLQLAVSEYSGLITKLSEQPDTARGAAEGAILRNSYFGRADALFDLERWNDAIEAYSAATNRYQHDPESLEAYVQIASCYRRLDRLSEARGTLEQARVVLQRIRPDANFTRTTRLARQDWAQLLDWLRTL